MKMWLLHALIAAVPFYLAAEPAWADNPDCGGEAKVVVVHCNGEGDEINCVQSGDSEGHNVFVKVVGDAPEGFHWITNGDDDGEVKVVQSGDKDDHAVVVSVTVDGDESDKGVEKKLRVFARKIGDSGKGAFLGISLTSSTDDDDNDEGGVRISGVVGDGPAAKAGLKEGDVVLEIGGESVASGVGALTKALRAHKPGDAVDVVVRRDGDEETFSVTLGSGGSIATSLAFGPGGVGEMVDSVQARGHIVLKNDDGDWEIKNLGDLNALKDLPKNIKMFMPKTGSRTISITADGDGKVVTVKRKTDGETLVVVQRDGDIKVTRVDEDGEETVDAYADEDQLQKADEEVYDLLKDSTGNVVVTDFEGVGDGDGVFDFRFDIDTGDLHEDIAQWRSELDDSLGEAREAYERAMDELGTLKEGLHDQQGARMKRFRDLLMKGSDGKDFKFPGFAMFGKPTHAFEVRTDGTIEVKIRKSDSELVQLFDNAADLKDREPKLYKKYRDLMDENE